MTVNSGFHGLLGVAHDKKGLSTTLNDLSDCILRYFLPLSLSTCVFVCLQHQEEDVSGGPDSVRGDKTPL